MENATKALIIAGAVLIAILLISVGIMVFNASSEPINQATNSSEQQAVQMFNEPFLANVGTGLTMQQARSIISTYNAAKAKNPEHEITLTGKTLVSQLSAKKRYNITETYGEDGYISAINIAEIP